MSVIVLSRKKKKVIETLCKNGHIIIDVTSKSPDLTFVKLSPYYVWQEGLSIGDDGACIGYSVEAIWQGLKVFQNEGIDNHMITTKNIKQIKKRNATASRGSIIGHRFNSKIYSYIDARKELYIPLYKYMLKRYLTKEIELLCGLVKEDNNIVLLDYYENGDIENVKHPLSHASIIAFVIQEKLKYLNTSNAISS